MSWRNDYYDKVQCEICHRFYLKGAKAAHETDPIHIQAASTYLERKRAQKRAREIREEQEHRMVLQAQRVWLIVLMFVMVIG